MTIDPLDIAASSDWQNIYEEAEQRFQTLIQSGQKPDNATRLWIIEKLTLCTMELGETAPMPLIRLAGLAMGTAKIVRTKSSQKEAFISKTAREGKAHFSYTPQWSKAVTLAVELFDDFPSDKIDRKSPHYGGINKIARACGVDHSTVKNWINKPSFRREWIIQREMRARQDAAVARWKAQPHTPERQEFLQQIHRAVANDEN